MTGQRFEKCILVPRVDGEIKTAISIGKDESLDNMACRNKSLDPDEELARMEVMPAWSKKEFLSYKRKM